MIFTIFTNITNFKLLLASVSIVCIELENNCYKSNKLKKYSVHPAKIYSHCYGFLITAAFLVEKKETKLLHCSGFFANIFHPLRRACSQYSIA